MVAARSRKASAVTRQGGHGIQKAIKNRVRELGSANRGGRAGGGESQTETGEESKLA